VPEIDLYAQVHGFPMPRLGVNLYKNQVLLQPEEARLTKNLVWENGLAKRGGQSLLDSDQVVTSKAIVGLHQAYYQDGTSQTMAASDTFVKYLSGGTWTNVKTGLTSGLQTFFETVGWADAVYMSNGTDAPHKWDGSSSSALAAAPADTQQFLAYRDRILSIAGGDIQWSDSYDDTGWSTVGESGMRPDTKLWGMILHAVNDANQGIDAKVLIAGANGMYLFYGTDLRTPVTTGTYAIFQLGVSAGCNAPRTMCWTPQGSMWLGNDKQVYLLPFGSASPVPVGQKITSKTDQPGLESIPAGLIDNACAVYHDGYYKLSIGKSGGTYNTVQWWLDVDRMSMDEDGFAGPWFGPMEGQTISCFAKQSGAGGSGALLGGEAQAKGYVYTLHDTSVFGDIDPSDASSSEITCTWDSFFNPMGNPALPKDVHELEIEILNNDTSVTMNFYDYNETLKTGDSLSLLTTNTKWDSSEQWDSAVQWGGFTPFRQKHNVDPAIAPRRLSVRITNSSSTNDFELYSLIVKGIEQDLVFG
jgi:hypothetical protein